MKYFLKLNINDNLSQGIVYKIHWMICGKKSTIGDKKWCSSMDINSGWLHISWTSASVSSKIFHIKSLLHATHQFLDFFWTNDHLSQWLPCFPSTQKSLSEGPASCTGPMAILTWLLPEYPSHPTADLYLSNPSFPTVNISIQNSSTNVMPNIFKPIIIIFNWTLPSKWFICIFSVCIYITFVFVCLPHMW